MATSLARVACLIGRNKCVCYALALLLIGTSNSQAIQLAASPFDTNDEGWKVTGDAQSATPAYVATGGNPGGFIRGFDNVVGGVWVWSAPAKFLGNMSAAYGFPLTYDLRMRGSGPLFDDSDVILTGSGVSLYLIKTPPVPQDVAWTSYSALIQDVASWHVGGYSGPLATELQIRNVLTNVTSLQIRGEFISGADNGDLDNVVLNGALLGDYNLNGVVDAPDYVVWRNGLGTTYTPADYDVWRAHFGQSSPLLAAGGAVSVPEPASLALLAVVGGFAAIWQSFASRPNR